MDLGGGRVAETGYDVALLVKNDSGLGHIRRATLLSKQLSRRGISSVVVSQASSLAMFNDPDLRVVNFPLLERLKSSAADEAYAGLLDAVSSRLDPTLVVEDTYPDRCYLTLPSLRHLPRVLVLRRLDPVSFEHVRAVGQFSYYDKVLVAQDPSDFDAERHTRASRRLVASSGRFEFVGPIFHRPSPDEVRAVKKRYAVGDRPLVVVNAGSGGDQLNDAYADRLFASAARIASRWHQDGRSIRFVLVLGPYYRGRPLQESPNLCVVGFEKHLAALLSAASVVLMRPGHNVLHEALCGDAELILVPGIPWMEGQQEFAERMAGRVGASVVEVGDDAALERCIAGAVERSTRHRKSITLVDGTQRAVNAIEEQLGRATTGPSVRRQRTMLVVLPPSSMGRVANEVVGALVSEDVQVVVDDADSDDGDLKPGPGEVHRLSQVLERGGSPTVASDAVYVDVEMPAAVTPLGLAEMGVLLALYVDEGDVGMRMRRWTSFAGTDRPAIIDAALERVEADGRRAQHLGWALASSRATGISQGLLIDCHRLDELQFKNYLAHLREWLDRLDIEPMPQEEFVNRRVCDLYGSGSHGDGGSP